MRASKVLIVKLPELHADVKALEAFRAYVCDALGAGALVLPLGTTYAVEDFPALGAVEVVAETVPDSGKPEKTPLPDIPAAEGVSRPEPKPVEPPPTRPPAEAVSVPKPTEIKLPVSVGQATPQPRFAGRASSEKADIHARLNRYWSEKGPGAMNRLSEACGLDASKLYLMQRNEGTFDIEHWRAVSAGLDKLGYGGTK